MINAHEFLKALTIVLCVAAATTVIFQRLKQPVVLGYIIAGLLVGPHMPVPFVANGDVVRMLSEHGVVLLMFSLGLDFSLRKLIAVGPTAAVTAIVQSSLMLWLGFVVGKAFGWSTVESVFTGAIIANSSTTIIAKAFDEQNVRGKLRELVVGVLVVQDLIGILLMAALTALASRGELSGLEFAALSGKLTLFLVALIAVGMLLVPRAIRAIAALNRPETLLVASIGICFGTALLADELGYSGALGAFIAGSLIAESGEDKRVGVLVEPVRDVFAAVFFVSVGMLIDPTLVLANWPAIVVLTLVVLVGQTTSAFLGSFLTGNGLRTSVQAGMSMAQIGEFSFILAALGLSLKATGAFLYPVAVMVSAITTWLTPTMIRRSGPVAAWLDGGLPRPLQLFVSLYGSWWEELRRKRERGESARIRRALWLLAIDTLLLAVLIVVVSVYLDLGASFVSAELHIGARAARYSVLALAYIAALPFLSGIIRLSRRIGGLLAEAALPKQKSSGRVDFAAAPRRLLLVTLQMAVLLLASLPLLAITQPFGAGVAVPLLVAAAIVALGVSFWRGAKNLQGHVSAASEVIIAMLAKQSRSAEAPAHQDATALAALAPYLPGLGNPAIITLDEGSGAVGRTLSEMAVRSISGATVLAITRADGASAIPTADERLRHGDKLALAGSAEAIDAATAMLLKPSAKRGSSEPRNPPKKKRGKRRRRT